MPLDMPYTPDQCCTAPAQNPYHADERVGAERTPRPSPLQQAPVVTERELSKEGRFPKRERAFLKAGQVVGAARAGVRRVAGKLVAPAADNFDTDLNGVVDDSSIQTIEDLFDGRSVGRVNSRKVLAQKGPEPEKADSINYAVLLDELADMALHFRALKTAIDVREGRVGVHASVDGKAVGAVKGRIEGDVEMDKSFNDGRFDGLVAELLACGLDKAAMGVEVATLELKIRDIVKKIPLKVLSHTMKNRLRIFIGGLFLDIDKKYFGKAPRAREKAVSLRQRGDGRRADANFDLVGERIKTMSVNDPWMGLIDPMEQEEAEVDYVDAVNSYDFVGELMALENKYGMEVKRVVEGEKPCVEEDDDSVGGDVEPAVFDTTGGLGLADELGDLESSPSEKSEVTDKDLLTTKVKDVPFDPKMDVVDNGKGVFGPEDDAHHYAQLAKEYDGYVADKTAEYIVASEKDNGESKKCAKAKLAEPDFFAHNEGLVAYSDVADESRRSDAVRYHQVINNRAVRSGEIGLEA
jgi:hypothetical protein